MKFERLNSSIALNAREQPSIYMAMCMVESLFRDVETAAGTELSHADLGDEQLPTKLIWLGRQLLKIYTENSDDLVRNRSRLDQTMEKIREQEKSLAGLTELSGKLSDAEEQYAALKKRMEEAENQRQTLERLQEACRQTQERLDQLGKLDPTEARQELEQLSCRERELSQERDNLLSELDRRRKTVAAMEDACKSLEADSLRCRDRIRELDQSQKDTSAALTELNAGIAERKDELNARTLEKDKLLEEQAYLEQQLLELKQELEDYEQTQMAPIRAEYENGMRERESLQKELSALKQNREDAVLQVARLNQQTASARQAMEGKQGELQQKQAAAELAAAARDKLQKQVDEETDRLSALQREAAELEQTQLPRLQTLIRDQEQQIKQHKESIDSMEQRKEKLLWEVERLKREDAALSAEKTDLQQTHDALIASSEANNEKVQKLRRDVEELRGKNDREKEKRYLKQLEEEQNELSELSRSCAELERQLETAQNNLDSKRAQAMELQSKKKSAEEAARQIRALIQTLAPQGDAELQRQVAALQSRQSLLEDTHKSLEEAVALMQDALGAPPETLSSNPDGLSDSLQSCGRALDKLQKALVKCARNIKSEIKLNAITEEQ